MTHSALPPVAFAMKHGFKMYEDGLFSVQRVVDEAVDVGWIAGFSYEWPEPAPVRLSTAGATLH